jgi:iron complex outermembrane receptor protein
MKSFKVVWLALGLIVLPLPAALGQEGQAVLEEITVTAQKREQSAQDIPVSVTVLSGEDLLQLGIENSNGVADYTPGLTISPVFGVGNIPNIAIRGIGLNDFRDYHESPSAVYVDEVYKAALASLDFQLFDIDRVEVLKGPQGTLFGRNATGGLIQYVTKKPTDEAEGYARLGAGNFGDMKVEGAFGGPISDSISGRIAAIYHKNDGIQHNVNPVGEDANQTDLTAVRGQLKFKFADQGFLLFTGEAAKNDNPGGNPYRYVPSFVGTDGLSDRDLANRDVVVGTSDLNDINVSGGLKVDSDYKAGTARLEWGFDSFDFVSISNYQDFEKRQIQDCDSSPADFCFTLYDSNTKQFSQELRLQGDRDKLQWDAGLYYFNLKTDGLQSLAGPIAGFFIAPGTNSTTTSFDTETTSWAAFGQVAYSVSDRVTLIGGLRYTDDKKDMTQIFLLTDPEDALGFTGGVPYPKETQDENNVSYSAKITWDVNDTTMLYGGISNAFKAGTFNSGFGPVDPAAYSVKPEELTSYEIGFKSELGGGRQRLTGAVFYYDYKDSQAFIYRNLNQLLFNADATVTGAELEWTALPIDSLEISAGISLLDTTVKDVQDGSGAIRDRKMVLAPDLSMNAMARYTWDLSGGSALAAQLDGNYSSDVYFDNLNQPGLKEGAYTKLNARLSWMSNDDRWEVAAWVRNLTDERYRIYAFDLTADLGYIQDTYATPRTYGVSLGVNF